MTGRPTETIDLESLPDQGASDTSTAPGLVLAFAATPERPIERRRLPPEGLVIGRDLAAFASGPLDDRRLSRRHAQLVPRGDGWSIIDLKSRNGVRVNGQAVDGSRTLELGDVIRLGDTLLVFAPVGRLPPSDPELVGQSGAMAVALRSLRSVAPHPYSVLLLGETGTGKEVAARALHRLSERHGSFVATNCAAFAEGVLESELFGHVKGAFTDARQSRDGLFKAADWGTLFLDEIGDMPLPLQSRLLRALETGTVRPVGGARELSLHVRVVAATNRDLNALVRDGGFRADLYARLTQWTLTLPPLRERREDIPLLIRHLLEPLNAAGRPLSAELAEALLIHPWPLNVRGLKNVLSTAVVASADASRLLLSAEVQAALASYRGLIADPTPGAAEGAEAPAGESARQQPSIEALKAALRRNSGSVAAAARDFGASRQQVYRWLRSFELELDDFRD